MISRWKTFVSNLNLEYVIQDPYDVPKNTLHTLDINSDKSCEKLESSLNMYITRTKAGRHILKCLWRTDVELINYLTASVRKHS